MAARQLIESEPSYSQVSARLLLNSLKGEVLNYLDIRINSEQQILSELYPQIFKSTRKRCRT